MLKQEPDYQDFQSIPEDEMETVYLYAYTEDPEEPPVWSRLPLNRDHVTALCMGLAALVLLVGLCLFIPLEPPSTVKTISVPAQVSVQDVHTSMTIIPTGTRTISATRATGRLTIYNGSFLAEQIPAGFMVSTPGGIEIVTDQAVIVPGANLPVAGVAEVSAHALVAGSQGNISASSIDEQYGSALTIKNLTAFTGGQDTQTEHYVTGQDQTQALTRARARLVAEKQHGMQVRPCSETVRQTSLTLAVAWTCQFIHYRFPPGLQVLSVQLVGNRVLVRVQVPPSSVLRQVVR